MSLTGAPLSPREREVFAAVMRGQSRREIAARLGITVKTVETHIVHIREKWGLDRHAPLLLAIVRHQAGELETLAASRQGVAGPAGGHCLHALELVCDACAGARLGEARRKR
jgi:DNA-binding CsgD family transcriptional regulator